MTDYLREGWRAHGRIARNRCPYKKGRKRREWLAGWDAACELFEAGLLGWDAEPNRPIPVVTADVDDRYLVDAVAGRWIARQVAELLDYAPLH